MKVKKSPSHRRGDAKSTSCTCCYGAGVESPLTLLSICSACAGGRDPTYAAKFSMRALGISCVSGAGVELPLTLLSSTHPMQNATGTTILCQVNRLGGFLFAMPRTPRWHICCWRNFWVHLWHCGAGAQATLLMYACSLHPARAR